MVTFALVPFRLSDNPEEGLHVYDVFAKRRDTFGEQGNPTEIRPNENTFVVLRTQCPRSDTKIWRSLKFLYFFNVLPSRAMSSR